MAMLARTAIAIALTALGLRPVSGQDIAAGEKLARQWCSGCHQVDNRAAPPLGLAPSFGAISRAKGVTQTSIEVFLSTPHEIMPNYTLSQKQIRDVAGYIESLRGQI